MHLHQKSKEHDAALLTQNLLLVAAISTVIPTASASPDSDCQEAIANAHVAIIIDRKRPSLIKTHVGDVTCAVGTSALVFDTSKAVAVYNLDSKNSNDITLKLATGQVLPVGLGQQLVVPRQEPVMSFAEINPAPKISVRNPVITKLQSGRQIYHADFSIASVLTVVDPLRLAAKEKPLRYRAGIERIMKNAVILSQVTGSHGAYTMSNKDAGK